MIKRQTRWLQVPLHIMLMGVGWLALCPQPLAAQGPAQVAGPQLRVPSTAQARLRPLGSPSLVDQFQPRTPAQPLHETSHRLTASPLSVDSSEPFPVRQTVMQIALPNQGAQGSSTRVPSNSFSSPSITAPSLASPGTATLGGANPSPRTLPPPPGTGLPLTPSPSDQSPVTVPALSNQFANVNNCACVTGPSGYVASFQGGCGGIAPANFQTPVIPAVPFTPPPAQVQGPVVLPGQAAPAAASTAAPAGALLTLGQETNLVQVGPGIIGQPKAYVPGQTIRNWIRYLTP